MNQVDAPTWKYEVFPHSFNWWQCGEMERALKHGEKMMHNHQNNKPSYFTIEGRNGSRPFKLSVTYDTHPFGCRCEGCCA